jgi:hypothetical protein
MCRVTRAGRRCQSFEGLEQADLDSTNVSRTYDEMFSDGARRLLTRELENRASNALYRGWFSWHPLRRHRLHWIPLIKTARRKQEKGWKDHPTMLVAQHGEGVIFATTMLLASNFRARLVKSMLKASFNLDSLPTRRRPTVVLQRVLSKNVAPLAASLVASPLTIWIASNRGLNASGSLQGIARAVLIPLFAVLTSLLASLFALSLKLFRELTGT